ncbi:hypothetical protein [Haloprofundus halobius]|uniref:hypothetical protein n=1 Tax=Haloprofundus halobius TaxID=2876194 RepID=UPI001CCC4D0E|nr:hypothetical protein [Haloprofundus halobius]
MNGVNRRTYLASVGASAALAGCTTLAAPQDDSRPNYLGREIVYERDGFELSLLDEVARLGETVAFEATNTGESEISLGCNSPWAIQRETADGWQHTTWTGGRYFEMCYSALRPGDSVREVVTLSESALDGQVSELHTELRPGQYRFVLIGSEPYLATDFEILE